jgi:hypothetical protein
MVASGHARLEARSHDAMTHHDGFPYYREYCAVKKRIMARPVITHHASCFVVSSWCRAFNEVFDVVPSPGEVATRGRSLREVNMRFRDEVIASYLDDEWRTPPAVHRLLGDRGTVADIASALERLARAGKIEAKHEAVMAPRYRGKAGPPVLCIDFYRKLQRRTPQHGDEGAGARHPIAKPSRTAFLNSRPPQTAGIEFLNHGQPGVRLKAK